MTKFASIVLLPTSVRSTPGLRHDGFRYSIPRAPTRAKVDKKGAQSWPFSRCPRAGLWKATRRLFTAGGPPSKRTEGCLKPRATDSAERLPCILTPKKNLESVRNVTLILLDPLHRLPRGHQNAILPSVWLIGPIGSCYVIAIEHARVLSELRDSLD